MRDLGASATERPAQARVQRDEQKKEGKLKTCLDWEAEKELTKNKQPDGSEFSRSRKFFEGSMLDRGEKRRRQKRRRGIQKRLAKLLEKVSNGKEKLLVILGGAQG